MKDFVYNCQGLRGTDYKWLRKIGLIETLWVLDIEWLHSSHDRKTYNEWIR